MEDLITVRQAAERLGVTRQTVLGWIKRGHLEGAFKIGERMVVLPASALDDAPVPQHRGPYTGPTARKER